MIFAPYRQATHHPVWGRSFLQPHYIVVRPSSVHEEEPSNSRKPQSPAKEQTDTDADKPKGKKDIPTEKVLYRGQDLQVSENPSTYKFQMDLPGVRSSDATVELVEEGLLRIQAERSVGGFARPQITRQFAFDDACIDKTNVKANIVDGVLNITLPKREKEPSPEPVDIAITAGYVPKKDDASNTKTLFTVDLPGVPIDRVKMSYHEDRVLLHAERLRAGQVVSKLQRVLPVNSKKVDTNKMKAYLADGVLEVLAPEKEATGPIVVPITSEPLPELLPVSPKKDSVLLETVSEGEEAAEDAESRSMNIV